MGAIQQMLLAEVAAAAGHTYATLDPANKGGGVTLSNGNLTDTHSGGNQESVRSTISVTTGKWYWEVHVDSNQSQATIGIVGSTATMFSYVGGNNSSTGSWAYYKTGEKLHGSSASYGATYTTGDTIGVALDMDAGTLTFYKNNVSQGQAYSGISGTIWAAVGTVGGSETYTVNFGASAQTYSPPAGYNAGLYS